MAKFLAVLLILIGSLTVAFPAEAAFCRTLNDHAICILQIKRSAKYHWEYRASVSIDGVARPVEIYNCRDRLWTRKDGRELRFEPNGAGDLICNLVNKRAG